MVLLDVQNHLHSTYKQVNLGGWMFYQRILKCLCVQLVLSLKKLYIV